MYKYRIHNALRIHSRSTKMSSKFVSGNTKPRSFAHGFKISSYHTAKTEVWIVYSTVCSGADQRKHQNSASLAFVWEIHRWPVNSPNKWPVTRKMFPFDDVIMSNPRILQFLVPYIHGIKIWPSLCRHPNSARSSACAVPTTNIHISKLFSKTWIDSRQNVTKYHGTSNVQTKIGLKIPLRLTSLIERRYGWQFITLVISPVAIMMVCPGQYQPDHLGPSRHNNIDGITSLCPYCNTGLGQKIESCLLIIW